MSSEDRNYYNALSDKTGFQKDILEKVHRLLTILEFINANSFLRERLVLKGGTALNLTVFNLPRLSVDIDLDFHSYASREVILEERKHTKQLLLDFLQREGYEILPKSKDYFSLESIVSRYENHAGNGDNLKIEINYSLRHHVLPIIQRNIQTEIFGETGQIQTLSALELLAAKTAALYNRLAARDFYDMYNVKQYGIIPEQDYPLFCKCVVFYRTLTSDKSEFDFSSSVIDGLTERKIKTDLYPMLIKRSHFNLEQAKIEVKKFLDESIVITPKLEEYMQEFFIGNFKPELLFSGDMLERVREHPMALWKIQHMK